MAGSRRSQSQPPPYDLTRLREMADGDEEFIGDLTTTFIADTAERLDVLYASIASRDAEGLRSEAHTIKGACGNFGAVELQSLALCIEHAAAAGNLTDAADALEEFKAEFARVCAYAEGDAAA